MGAVANQRAVGWKYMHGRGRYAAAVDAWEAGLLRVTAPGANSSSPVRQVVHSPP
jgi:hypothetical protein